MKVWLKVWYQNNIHNSKIRRITEDVADDEMMIDYNGPDIGEADRVLIESLYLHFKDNQKGIHFYTANIFRYHGITVENILSAKSCLPLYKLMQFIHACFSCVRSDYLVKKCCNHTGHNYVYFTHSCLLFLCWVRLLDRVAL